MDPIAEFKVAQRKSWATFVPFEAVTTMPAASLVKWARVQRGQRVLDVGCGTGVVAITAARTGARVSGLDLTPELLDRARENAAIANVEVDWKEGDAEALPYPDATFDVVLSQFGHMFAPRPDVAMREMLRVLKPGGTVAFSTWPPELFTGRMFLLTSKYLPPLPPGVSPPTEWGDPNVVRQRLGGAVKEITFDRDVMRLPAMSIAHPRVGAEKSVGPIKRVVELLQSDLQKLAEFRREYDALTADYFDDNHVRQDFLMTRAIKL